MKSNPDAIEAIKSWAGVQPVIKRIGHGKSDTESLFHYFWVGLACHLPVLNGSIDIFKPLSSLH